MRRVDVVASEQHYLSHMVPIWAHLCGYARGTVHPLAAPGHVVRPPMRRLAMVAGWQDVQPLRGMCEMIYVEHGAGQAYSDRMHDPSYSGSGGLRHRGVVGFIAPSQKVADRWNGPSIAVGCPKMDFYIGMKNDLPIEPIVCFVWHWDCKLSPEASSAWPHYEPLLDEIVDRFQTQGFRVVAHEHPKWRGKMNRTMLEHGIEVLESDDEVFKRANLMIVDNSSLATEFMLIGKPVIFLNAPWYRRDIDHGGRFWEWVQHHPVIDEPDQLMGLNLWDYAQPSLEHAKAIRRTASSVYAYTDGSSSRRAAEWIEGLIRDG